MRIKNIFLIGLLNIVFLFSACSENSLETKEERKEEIKSSYTEGSPEYIADSFLLKFKANNIADMRSYMIDGIFSLDENSLAQNEAVKYTWDTITENFEYEFLNSEIKNDDARVMVKMRNIAMSAVMMDTYEEFNTKEISRKQDAKEDDIVAEFYPILKKYTENYKNKEKLEKTVPIDLIKSGDKWEIVNDIAVFDAMTGDYMSFVLRDLKNYVILEDGENG